LVIAVEVIEAQEFDSPGGDIERVRVHGKGFRLISFSRMRLREAFIESSESLIQLSSPVISLK
jgi:hypothetical protein